MSSLVVRDVRARYGAVEALHGVSLEVNAGEIVAVIGPNGAGKSTLVRCVAGLHRAMDGTVAIEGTLAAVGDRRDLVPTLTVERYLNLVLDSTGVARATALFPNIRDVLGRRCGLLSGGEAQMVALGRALGGEPAVVVVDEISQGLAPVALKRLLPAVRAAADAGTAVLLVEQFAHAAASVADRVVVLDQGTVTYDGAVADAPLESAYLAGTADGPAPTPVLTDVTVGLLPAQRRALAARAARDGSLPGEVLRQALDRYLAKK